MAERPKATDELTARSRDEINGDGAVPQDHAQEEERLPDPEYLPKLSVAERVARAEMARREVPPDCHADWRPSRLQMDPIDVLEQQALDREPDLVPLRHGRMSMSPFAFYRGGAAVMASDLAGTPDAGLTAQLCGDAHLLNFGVFQTPERSLIFGLNDFDETLPGPFEWDVKRLAASVEIAGRDLGHSPKKRAETVEGTVRAYREAMIEFASLRNIDFWHTRLPAEQLRKYLKRRAGGKSGKAVRKKINKALTRNHLRAFDRLVERVDGEIRFISNPPLLVPVEELLDRDGRNRYVEVVEDFLRRYRGSLPAHRRALVESYRFVHGARKVVGVGSVGTRAWVVLMMGRDAGDPLILQLKEAKRSVLEPYLRSSTYRSHGRRVVEGQRLMQSASDEFLGWHRHRALDGQMHDYYMRQLWDGKASIEVADLDRRGLMAYGEACARALARGHARSGDRVAIAAYLGEDTQFDRALVEFARTYADVNEADYQKLLDAVSDGRLPAVMEG